VIALSESGLVFVSGGSANALGQVRFEEEFARVWGKYFPYIIIGAVTFMIFVLLRKMK